MVGGHASADIGHHHATTVADVFSGVGHAVIGAIGSALDAFADVMHQQGVMM